MGRITVENTPIGTIIAVEGSCFSCQDHEAFNAAYRGRPMIPANCTVDLTRVERIDTAALGMLLLMRESVDNPSEIVIRTGDRIRKILTEANFDQVFKLV